VKKVATLLLCLIIVLSILSFFGCSKKTPVDVEAMAIALCFFDEKEIEVERIQKMAILRDGSEPWYVYKYYVTVHLEGGDLQDILGTIFDPEGILSGRICYASEKGISYNEHNPSAGTAFVIWEMMENDHKKAEISEIPEKDIPQIVSQAWTYIEENNIHPEEEN